MNDEYRKSSTTALFLMEFAFISFFDVFYLFFATVHTH